MILAFANILNDKTFAEKLCEKSKEAISDFLEYYSDELYYIASKFNYRGMPQDSWEYRTKTGYSIQVSDEVADTYLWLVNQATNKSCAYKGKKGASFSTFIKTVLNSNFTFKDWLKWKTGVTGYVPKCISSLGNPCIDIFRLLRENKSPNVICRKLDLDNTDYVEYFNRIEESLIISNQIDLLHKPKTISIDAHKTDSEEDQPIQIVSDEFNKPSDEPEVQLIIELIEKIKGDLTSAERRLLLLYWGNGYNVEKIYDTFQLRPYQSYLNELNITASNDIYASIEKIMKKSIVLFDQDYHDSFHGLKMNPKNMKDLFKTYFQYFAKK